MKPLSQPSTWRICRRCGLSYIVTDDDADDGLCAQCAADWTAV